MTPYEFVVITIVVLATVQSALVWRARLGSIQRPHALGGVLVTLVAFVLMYVVDLAPSRSVLMF